MAKDDERLKPMSTMTIPSKDGQSFSAYVAMPAKLPAPTVIVIQEIFGVNEGIRAKCDWLASEGFIAVAPDLFWRIEPGVELSDKTDAEWEKAFDLMNMFDIDNGIEDLKAVKHTFRGHADSNGKVGCIGYCLGGKVAYLMGCRSDIEASVGYYGVGIDQLLAEANHIDGAIMMHVAEEDEYVDKHAQQVMKNGLADNDKVTVYSYPGVNHAFSRVNGQNYNKEAATLADGRTLTFLHEHLG